MGGSTLTCGDRELSTGPLVPSIVAGVSNALILPLFIYRYDFPVMAGGHMC